MAPLFADSLNVCLELATGFDTDTLGTFTRDVARRGSQLEAARSKAKKGMELLSLDVGVASEGSFRSDWFGLFPLNLELVVLVDRARDLEIVGRAGGPAHHFHDQVTTLEALSVFARKVEFPSHGLVVRPDHQDDPRVRKGLVDWPALSEAFEAALAESSSSAVFVESELRAHMNPTRMKTIRRATEDLIARTLSECPRCRSPGFWAVESVPGLPCRDCRAPTDEPRAQRWECIAGDYVELRNVNAGRLSDPSRCPSCNP